MGYVALRRLRWGDGHIEVGDPVPEGEPGRSYHWMVRSGQIGGLPSKPTVKAASQSGDAGEKPAPKAPPKSTVAKTAKPKAASQSGDAGEKPAPKAPPKSTVAKTAKPKAASQSGDAGEKPAQ